MTLIGWILNLVCDLHGLKVSIISYSDFKLSRIHNGIRVHSVLKTKRKVASHLNF